jgi:hypothetical protein
VTNLIYLVVTAAFVVPEICAVFKEQFRPKRNAANPKIEKLERTVGRFMRPTF